MVGASAGGVEALQALAGGLTAKLDAAGRVTAVSLSYPRDYVKQQLGYAAMYGLQ